MNFEAPKQNKPEMKKEPYMDLVNDFGIFITLNTVKLEQEALPCKEAEIAELRKNLRKPIINGMNYSDFVFNNPQKLQDEVVAKALLTQIHAFLGYIEPQLVNLKQDNSWSKRFFEIKQKYINLISNLV